MRYQRLFILGCLVLGFLYTARAQPGGNSQQVESSIGLEIDGLIVDETRTKAGRDFYELFYKQWQAPPQARDFSLLISEKPVQGRTTQIEVRVDNEQLTFQANLQPRYEVIEELVQYAIVRTQQFLARRAQTQQQLGPGEFQRY